MSSVVISGDTSGAITVSAPAVSGTNTLTLQAGTGTNSMNTLSTAANTTGTSVTFGSLPSWVKRITVMLSNVTISGTTVPAFSLRLGTVSGIESTGYVGYSLSGGTTSASTTGFIFRGSGSAVATDGVLSINLQNLTTNTWCAFGVQYTGITNQYGAGTKSLAGTLTQLALVTNGTDTFTAGSVNILYEG